MCIVFVCTRVRVCRWWRGMARGPLGYVIGGVAAIDAYVQGIGQKFTAFRLRVFLIPLHTMLSRSGAQL